MPALTINPQYHHHIQLPPPPTHTQCKLQYNNYMLVLYKENVLYQCKLQRVITMATCIVNGRAQLRTMSLPMHVQIVCYWCIPLQLVPIDRCGMLHVPSILGPSATATGSVSLHIIGTYTQLTLVVVTLCSMHSMHGISEVVVACSDIVASGSGSN